MMTIEKMRKTLENLGKDISWKFDEKENSFYVTINDGCNGCRKYNNPQAVENFEDMLDEECFDVYGDWFTWYEFKDFDLRLSYVSMDYED
jgi:hypothetical protein